MSPRGRRSRKARLQRLADDAIRTVRFLDWVIKDAQRLRVQVPEVIPATLWAWRAWAAILEQQAKDEPE